MRSQPLGAWQTEGCSSLSFPSAGEYPSFPHRNGPRVPAQSPSCLSEVLGCELEFSLAPRLLLSLFSFFFFPPDEKMEYSPTKPGKENIKKGQEMMGLALKLKLGFPSSASLLLYWALNSPRRDSLTSQTSSKVALFLPPFPGRIRTRAARCFFAHVNVRGILTWATPPAVGAVPRVGARGAGAALRPVPP